MPNIASLIQSLREKYPDQIIFVQLGNIWASLDDYTKLPVVYSNGYTIVERQPTDCVIATLGGLIVEV